MTTAGDDDDPRSAFVLAADALLLPQADADGWLRGLAVTYQPVFERIGADAGGLAAAVARDLQIEGSDLEVIRDVTQTAVASVVTESGKLVAGAVFLASSLLGQLAATSGRSATEILRELIERNG